FPVDESTTGNVAIWKAEEAINSIEKTRKHILRLGGLAGPDRFLARHFSGKVNLPGGNHPVNLLHRDDAVSIILKAVEDELPEGIYNVCSSQHPTREELYTYDCERFGLRLPHFANDWETGKTISTEKIREHVDFKYPNPKEYDYSDY